jgi:hypothetical protein
MNRTTWIIGAAALVVLLIAAAFVGGQLLNTEAAADASPFQMVTGQSETESGANAQGMQTTFEMEMESAREIPQTEPDVVGLLARRGDKSIFITTGKVVVAVGINPDGTLSVNGTADGPEVEVVIPHTAQIYVDTTALTSAGAPQADGMREQTVEPGTVDEIGENSIISVWGERRGDRVIAHTALYMADALSAIPNPNQ